jgi:DNA-binding NarL/FixJ family response regulator
MRFAFPASCNAIEWLRCDAGHMKLRVLIVDDNERFLDVARASLGRDGIEVVATATTSANALRRTEEVRPDVVLVDVSLGEESGFVLTRQLIEAFPDLGLRVVLISTQGEDELVELIAASPAVGFIAKSRLSPEAVRDLVAAKGP